MAKKKKKEGRVIATGRRVYEYGVSRPEVKRVIATGKRVVSRPEVRPAIDVGKDVVSRGQRVYGYGAPRVKTVAREAAGLTVGGVREVASRKLITPPKRPPGTLTEGTRLKRAAARRFRGFLSPKNLRRLPKVGKISRIRNVQEAETIKFKRYFGKRRRREEGEFD